MLTREEFLLRRKSGIGGSDVAAVLGKSRFKTPFELWQDKTGAVTDVEDNDCIYWGNRLEAVVAEEAARRRGFKIQKRNKMYRHKDHPELIANIDRYIVGGGILECKTCSAFAAGKFGTDGDDVPVEYLMQVQHYMYVTGIHECTLAVLVGGNDFRIFDIPFDPAWANFAAGRCVAWWQTHVVGNVPPAATQKDVLAEYYSVKPGAGITATDDIMALIAELKGVKDIEKKAKDRIEALKFDIQSFAGECEAILDPAGDIVATWKRGKDRATVDIESLCEAFNITDEDLKKHTKYSVNRPLKLK